MIQILQISWEKLIQDQSILHYVIIYYSSIFAFDNVWFC